MNDLQLISDWLYVVIVAFLAIAATVKTQIDGHVSPGFIMAFAVLVAVLFK